MSKKPHLSSSPCGKAQRGFSAAKVITLFYYMQYFFKFFYFLCKSCKAAKLRSNNDNDNDNVNDDENWAAEGER